MDFNKQLADFKKSNKERKLKLATTNGFSTVESYLDFLLEKIKDSIFEPPPIKVEETKVTEPITIEKCVLLDCSGSMEGSKLTNAINGINEEIEALKKEDTNYLYTLITFEGFTVKTINLKTPIKEVNQVYFRSGGRTPLLDAIGKAYDLFCSSKNKVLINIFTDGEENSSQKYTRSQINRLIKGYDHITTTFVGTKFDVEQVQRDLGIDQSNTLSYDGTGQGLKMSMETTITATKSFANDVSRGVDVKKGFYKKIVK